MEALNPQLKIDLPPELLTKVDLLVKKIEGAALQAAWWNGMLTGLVLGVLGFLVLWLLTRRGGDP